MKKIKCSCSIMYGISRFLLKKKKFCIYVEIFEDIVCRLFLEKLGIRIF